MAGHRIFSVVPARMSLADCSLLAVWLLAAAAPPAAAQSTRWDSLLTNSHWYVPQDNLLAYTSTSGNFTTPPPTPLADQTLWSLGTANHGAFTGVATATLRPLATPFISTTSTSTIIPGLVTDAGEIRMRFELVPDGTRTVGIGQMRDIGGTTYMEMQMITGNGAAYVSHWAYMAQYDPATFTPPSVYPDNILLSPQWRWTEGSTWQFESNDLFGPGGSGTFTVTAYHNGYFWGPGTGPAGSPAASFTQMGSITPEGNVLFNVLAGGSLTSLAGQITGTGMTGQMALRSYDGEQFGTAAAAFVVAVAVPEIDPAGMGAAFALATGGLALLARRRRPALADDHGDTLISRNAGSSMRRTTTGE